MLTHIIDLFIFVLKLMSTRLACGHHVPPSEHHFEISVPAQSTHFFSPQFKVQHGVYCPLELACCTFMSPLHG